jgi:hypothetical protein
VGNDGETLVADSSTATGLAWAAPSTVAESLGFTAGKNRIINGDFYINQRSFTSVTSGYGFDRWKVNKGGNGTCTYTPQTFTPGTAPVAGYEGKTYPRLVTSGVSSANEITILTQYIEGVRTFADQTVTLSFWAKTASGTPKVAILFGQDFGTGGSPSAIVDAYFSQVTLSTSWTRYTVTGAIPSISGKTIGTNNDDNLRVYLIVSAGSDFNAVTGSLGTQNGTFEFWGVQLEAGSTATDFQTATGTLQGELSACQRYYYRASAGSQAYARFGIARASSTTNLEFCLVLPSTMRVNPTAVEFSSLTTTNAQNVSAAALNSPSQNSASIDLTVGSATANQPYTIMANNSTSAYVAVTAEL